MIVNPGVLRPRFPPAFAEYLKHKQVTTKKKRKRNDLKDLKNNDEARYVIIDDFLKCTETVSSVSGPTDPNRILCMLRELHERRRHAGHANPLHDIKSVSDLQQYPHLDVLIHFYDFLYAHSKLPSDRGT